MNRSFAQFISAVFHPLLMPSFSVVLLFQVNSYLTFTLPTEMKWLIMGLVFMNTFIFPTLFVVLLVKRKYIQSIFLDVQKERLLPFVLAFFFYSFTYYLLRRANLPPVLNSLMLGAAVSVIVSLGLNFISKISIHMVGIAGVIGAFSAIALLLNINILFLLIVLSIITGIVGTSRISMQKHTNFQLLIGALVGFFSEFLVVYYRLG